MNKIVFALALIFVSPAIGCAQDSLLEKVSKIESNNAALAARLSTMERKIDALAVKIDRLAAPAAPIPASLPAACPAGGCPAGCPGMMPGYGQSGSCDSQGEIAGRPGIFGRLRARRGGRGGCG
jgi:hypothetical protein